VSPDPLFIVLGVCVALYPLCLFLLLVAGRRRDARALAGFIPDCVILLRRLLADRRMPRSRKWAVLLLIAYLAVPLDLVPDFIPVAGQLDDAILVALVLRFVLRGAGPEALAQHWSGPTESARVIEAMVFGSPRRRHAGRAGAAPEVPRGGGGAGADPAALPPRAMPPGTGSRPTRRTRSGRGSGSSSPG
jgi:uncharacterized membrane protein YkvA (DUF1232 family)